MGVVIADLDKATERPRVGDVVIHSSDLSLTSVSKFTAEVVVSDSLPGQIKVGYAPQAYIAAGRATVRVTDILWKLGGDGKKIKFPFCLVRNDVPRRSALSLVTISAN